MLKTTKRVREIGYTHSSLSGRVNISNRSQEIQFESSLERDFIYQIEFDNKVSGFIEQPLKIKFKSEEGRSRLYTPDFLVEYHDKFRKNELIEIKYKKELTTKYDKLKEKFEAAKKFCIENDMIFRVLTEEEIRDEKSGLLANAKFLSRYRSYFDISINNKAIKSSSDISKHILKIMRNVDSITVEELVIESMKEHNDRGKILFLTWYLIANNYIDCNLSLEITMQSEIWMERLWKY